MRSAFRNLLAAAAVTAVLAGIAGCSATSGNAGGGDSGATITIWARAASISKDAQAAIQKKFPKDTIVVSKLGAGIDDKLRSGMRAKTGLPDVAIIAGNLPDYFEVSKQFLDEKQYGFTGGSDYVSWALKSGQDLSGRQIAIPTDIGPYGLFYRADIAKKLGYPTDPVAFGKAVSTWDEYTTFAKAAAAAGYKGCDSGNSAYQLRMLQKGYQYLQRSNGKVKPAVDSSVNKQAFQYAAGLITDKLCANVEPYTTEWNSAIAQNSVVAFVGPGYEEGILKPAAGTSTNWRVAATPGGPGASTGSFATALSSSKHPAEAAKVAQYLASPEMLKDAYKSQGLFPSAKSLYNDPSLMAGDPFYGGQSGFSVLAKAAGDSPFAFRGPGSAVIATQFRTGLTDIAQSAADPTAEFSKAVKGSAQNG